MVDISGPSGQPSQPNPFTSAQSQSGLSSNLSINTQSAQQALADFQKILDGMTKSFSGGWNKATKDSMEAQERFYKYIGDKDNERKIALERYRVSAIAAINEETKARINSYEQESRAGNANVDALRKKKVEASLEAAKQIENINRESSKKMAQEGGIGGKIRGATNFIGGQIGGPIGGLVSGAGNILTNPAEIIPAALIGAIIKMAGDFAEFNKTGSQLSNAGFRLGTGSDTALGFRTNLFGDPRSSLSQALSMDQQRNIIAAMTGSRSMIDQTGQAGGFAAVRNNLGLFANILPDAAKDMEIMTDATKNLNMSQEDITRTFISSRINSDRLNITQLDAIQTQLTMQKALRNITNDGNVAANTLSNITGYLNSIGASESEKARIGVAVAQAGANLSLPEIAGMFAFTHGGKMPTEADIFGINGKGGMLGDKGTGVFGLLGGFLTKIGSQFKDPMQRDFAADQLQRKFLPGLRLQDTPKFFTLAQQMMDGNISSKDFNNQFKQLESKTPQVVAADGIKRLAAIVDPIVRLEHFFDSFFGTLEGLFAKYFGPGNSTSNPYTMSKMVPTKKSIAESKML